MMISSSTKMTAVEINPSDSSKKGYSLDGVVWVKMVTCPTHKDIVKFDSSEIIIRALESIQYKKFLSPTLKYIFNEKLESLKSGREHVRPNAIFLMIATALDPQKMFDEVSKAAREIAINSICVDLVEL